MHQHHLRALAELPETIETHPDRMLVARSLAEQLPLVTADAAIR